MTADSQPLFIRQCHALIKTLESAKQADDATLSMGLWFTSHGTNEVGHFCDSAACICGYQVLADDLSLFPEAARYSNEIGMPKDDVASSLSNDLDASCGDIFGNNFLAESIYNGSAATRFHAANNHAHSFDEVEEDEANALLIHQHLKTDQDNFNYALDYLKAVVEYTEGYLERLSGAA